MHSHDHIHVVANDVTSALGRLLPDGVPLGRCHSIELGVRHPLTHVQLDAVEAENDRQNRGILDLSKATVDAGARALEKGKVDVARWAKRPSFAWQLRLLVARRREPSLGSELFEVVFLIEARMSRVLRIDGRFVRSVLGIAVRAQLREGYKDAVGNRSEHSVERGRLIAHCTCEHGRNE